MQIKVKSHYRTSPKGRKYVVNSYNQKRNTSRGKIPSKKYQRPRNNVLDTYWLKDEEGRFTGRANAQGITASSNHVLVSKDDTGNLSGKEYGRVFGRYPASWNRGVKKHTARPSIVKKGSSPIR
jgi:hypothetical protein